MVSKKKPSKKKSETTKVPVKRYPNIKNGGATVTVEQAKKLLQQQNEQAKNMCASEVHTILEKYGFKIIPIITLFGDETRAEVALVPK